MSNYNSTPNPGDALSGKVTQRKTELVTLEKKVQKQNKKMLKLMECINLVLECIDELEDQCRKKAGPIIIYLNPFQTNFWHR